VNQSMPRKLLIVALFCLAAIIVSCNTLPEGAIVLTCKPIIRQGKVEWRNGNWMNGKRKSVSSINRGGENISWPILILRNANDLFVIRFADENMLNMLNPSEVYTFAVSPTAMDERGIVFPSILWVEYNGKKIYRKKKRSN